MSKKEFGEYIARARTERGLSQAALAKAVGISRPYLTQIENGYRMPSDEKMQILLHVLGIPVEQVMEHFLRGQMPDEQLNAIGQAVRGYDALTQHLTAEQLAEVSAAMGSPEHIEATLNALSGIPLAPGPEGWLDLKAEDRRLVQRLVNRLRATDQKQ